jgi:cytochrome oxidase Cu insertion factor (SCO1/SenC/PrrC family)
VSVVTPPGEGKPVSNRIFVMAFVLGAVVLTAMPLMQRLFLKAPPPIGPVGNWSLTLADGGVRGSTELSGLVWLVAFAPSPCDVACVERQRSFGTAVGHTVDVAQSVRIVTVAAPNAMAAVATLGDARWWVLSGDEASVDTLMQSLHRAWATWAQTDAGATPADRLALPAFAVVDQNGQVRGFWRDDAAGRGNAINAARLLAKHGPQP